VIVTPERAQIVKELRFLATSRRDYCYACPKTVEEFYQLRPQELGVHEEHIAADWLADIIEGKNDARGWLPSWRWGEWDAVREASAETLRKLRESCEADHRVKAYATGYAHASGRTTLTAEDWNVARQWLGVSS